MEKCDNCGKKNTEIRIFKKGWLFGLTWCSVKVCQACVSTAFRSFIKNKSDAEGAGKKLH